MLQNLISSAKKTSFVQLSAKMLHGLYCRNDLVRCSYEKGFFNFQTYEMLFRHNEISTSKKKSCLGFPTIKIYVKARSLDEVIYGL